MIARPLEPDFIWITRHARERLREHHPHIGIRGATERLRRSTPIDGAAVAGLLQRPIERAADRYFLAEDRRGLFVVAESPDYRRPGEIHRSLVTYIRFLPSQVEQVTALWPVDAMEAA